MREQVSHWTEESPEAYAHSIVRCAEADAVLEELEDPRDLLALIRAVRTVGLKLSFVVYDDGDKGGAQGPVSGGIFKECWKRCGQPKDFFDLETNDPRFPHPVSHE